MANFIKLLPDHVANQIAAGEVVQRPASVVKELLENALDAGASSIKVIVKDAGKTLIQVIDDGQGMSETDARLSFERHATSKIKEANDLFALRTKGFRGEALASIAAVAQVELKTRTSDDDLGTCIHIAGSEIKSQEPVAAVKGTSVAVKNLFFNIPARRNFLKSQSVELRHIIDEFHRVALAHPEVVFALYHNEGELFNLPVGNLRQRIVAIFGAKTNEKLVPVQEETEIVTINGFVFKPQFAKKTRGEQFFFVNGRFIKSPYLNHAVANAFDGLLQERSRASYFLYLEVDPQTIDINIHPTKTEIKFEDEHALYALLRAAIKHSLGQFSVAPVLDFDRDATLDTPYDYKNKAPQQPKVEVDRDFNPFERVTPNTGGTPRYEKSSAAGWQELYAGMQPKSSTSGFSSVSYEEEAPNTEALFKGKDSSSEHLESEYGTSTYQLHRKYIVSTIKSGMVIIDQHRAHERVLYEELMMRMTGSDTVSQQLLFPLSLSFSRPEMEHLKAMKGVLEQTGFIFGELHEESVEIIGVPTTLSEAEVPQVIEQLLDDVDQDVPDPQVAHQELVARSLAKSMAVRAGERLEGGQQEHLVNRLFACQDPAWSPGNKKTFVTMSVGDLEKLFN
ncbi:DNA mismatch repair endonuclease MutL [Croceiramulus getboli]|nr:DNA mismatch repair endonuclease MutL [Flavobacteriaceae bacterium YJPT1-3]